MRRRRALMLALLLDAGPVEGLRPDAIIPLLKAHCHQRTVRDSNDLEKSSFVFPTPRSEYMGQCQKAETIANEDNEGHDRSWCWHDVSC